MPCWSLDRDWSLVWYGRHQHHTPLQEEPRYKAIMERVGCGHQRSEHAGNVRFEAASLETPVRRRHARVSQGLADQLPDLPRTDDGTYYVLSLDRHRGRFVLEHSTIHVGMWGPDHQLRTFTEIDGIRVPVDGYLRWFLMNLTARFKPNSSSST